MNEPRRFWKIAGSIITGVAILIVTKQIGRVVGRTAAEAYIAANTGEKRTEWPPEAKAKLLDSVRESTRSASYLKTDADREAFAQCSFRKLMEVAPTPTDAIRFKARMGELADRSGQQCADELLNRPWRAEEKRAFADGVQSRQVAYADPIEMAECFVPKMLEVFPTPLALKLAGEEKRRATGERIGFECGRAIRDRIMARDTWGPEVVSYYEFACPKASGEKLAAFCSCSIKTAQRFFKTPAAFFKVDATPAAELSRGDRSRVEKIGKLCAHTMRF